jgi:tetratricopeptide (TPR) repeat protein
MKRLLPLILLLSTHAQGQGMSRNQADSLAAMAQRAYAAGDHNAARIAYDSIAASFDSPALQLNIGNCWYKLGDAAHAILHYERGLRLAPSDPDLRANLDLANEQVKDRIAGVPAFTLGRWWSAFRSGPDPDAWSRRSLLASAALFVLLGLLRVLGTGWQRRLAQGAAALAAAWTLLSVGMAAARNRDLNDHSSGIIMSAKVVVLGEPRSESTQLFVLHKGSKVLLGETSDGWVEVRLPNGTQGWAPAADLERI